MAEWRLGTMGFGYPEWKGVFYPRGLRQADHLAHYATRFDTVELDTTFYATPAPSTIERWRDVTPPGFRFSAKAPRLVTHETPLPQAGGPLRDFVSAMGGLGDKLAVVLLQFAPSFTAENADALNRFLGELPDGVRFAVELRHRSWGSQPTLDTLRRHRCALVQAEYLRRPSAVHLTTDFLYVRWVGQHDRFAIRDHEQIDVTDALAWWAGELSRSQADASVIWGYFNNDYAGYSVGTAERFRQMVGAKPPDVPRRGQGELFG